MISYLRCLFSIIFIKNALALNNPVFFIEDGWYNQTHGGYIGHFKIPIHIEFVSWWIALVFENPIDSFKVWQGTFMKSNAEQTCFYFTSQQWNNHNYPGSIMDQRYMVEFRRRPNVNYRVYKGPRPWIVFRDKIYRPNPEQNDEYPMQEYNPEQIRLPWEVDDLPVPDAITRAPTTTLEPLTKGPNSGPFWWVRTRYPRPTRSTTTDKRSLTMTSETTTTSTVAPGSSCKLNRESRIQLCAHKQLQKCYIPSCYQLKDDEFLVVQCWQFHNICWCVNERTGKRTSKILRYNNRGSLPCIKKEETTTPQPVTAKPYITQLAQPPFAPRMNYDYNLVIIYSLRFFEAQRSGNLGADNRIRWRKNAHLSDGSVYGHDLSGGYYVSGDYVKYSFPTAAAITMLAWGFLEFPNAYENSEQVERLKESLKWATDYFIKCHVSKYSLYGQVGDAAIENSYWERPQDMKVNRPCYAVGVKNPGSDLAAEVAAALAATAKVWIKCGANKNDPYVKELLDHARDLYDFALKYRQIYSVSIRAASDHYKSTGYEDELVWAALWLYQATEDGNFLMSAGRMFDEYRFGGAQYEISWDNKIVPVQLLLAQLGPDSHSTSYFSHVKEFCEYNLPGNGAPYTSEGFLFINQWSASSYAGNAALICLIASKFPLLDAQSKQAYRKFGEDQVDYLLGKMGRSYMVGYGKDFPRKPHHRSSSCTRTGPCGWVHGYESPEDNPYMLIGALVGGPDNNDQWTDNRGNYTTNGVSLNNNAGFQGAVAGLRHFQLEYEEWREWKANNKP